MILLIMVNQSQNQNSSVLTYGFQTVIQPAQNAVRDLTHGPKSIRMSLTVLLMSHYAEQEDALESSMVAESDVMLNHHVGYFQHDSRTAFRMRGCSCKPNSHHQYRPCTEACRRPRNLLRVCQYLQISLKRFQNSFHGARRNPLNRDRSLRRPLKHPHFLHHHQPLPLLIQLLPAGSSLLMIMSFFKHRGHIN